MLQRVRNFIQKERVVSIQQLTRVFSIDEQALKPLLTIWENKGIIQVCQKKLVCQTTCWGCYTKIPLYYQYITEQ